MYFLPWSLRQHLLPFSESVHIKITPAVFVSLQSSSDLPGGFVSDHVDGFFVWQEAVSEEGVQFVYNRKCL